MQRLSLAICVFLCAALVIGLAGAATAELTVTIVQPVSDTFSANINDWVTFEAVAYQDGVELDDTTVQWSWDFGDSTQSTDNPAYHVYTASGDYVVTVTATVGQATGTATISGTVVVPSGLTVTIVEPTPSQFPPPVDQSTTFHATAYMDGVALDDSAVQWFWDFGDNTQTSDSNPVDHTYTIAGSYIVTVVATVDDQTAMATLPLTAAGADQPLPPHDPNFANAIYVTAKPDPQIDVGDTATVNVGATLNYMMWASDYATWGRYDANGDLVEQHKVASPMLQSSQQCDSCPPNQFTITPVSAADAPPHPDDPARAYWVFNGTAMGMPESDRTALDSINFQTSWLGMLAGQLTAQFPNTPVRILGNGNGLTYSATKKVNVEGTCGWLYGTIMEDNVPVGGATVQLLRNGVPCGPATTLDNSVFKLHDLAPGAYTVQATWGMYSGEATATVIRVMGVEVDVNMTRK